MLSCSCAKKAVQQLSFYGLVFTYIYLEIIKKYFYNIKLSIKVDLLSTWPTCMPVGRQCPGRVVVRVPVARLAAAAGGAVRTHAARARAPVRVRRVAVLRLVRRVASATHSTYIQLVDWKNPLTFSPPFCGNYYE